MMPEKERISFSIVMPTLNAERFLEDAIASVLRQAGEFALSLLVVDGGSTDGTLSILQGISDPRVQIICDAGKGQAAAINLGLQQVQGNVLAWLNGDDRYLPGSLAAVAQAFAEHADAQWLAGRCEIIDAAGKPTRGSVTRFKERLAARFSFESLLRMNMLSQPAVFWRRDFGERIGKLDESLHWTMDYDLWLRMAQAAEPLMLEKRLASFRVHGSSKSAGGHRAQFEEGYQVASRYAGDRRLAKLRHRLAVEKIVWGYRALRWLRR